MKRLAIITTHPIQYNAPLFNLLSERNRIELKVFYTWSQSRSGKLYDPGFAKSREWDIPLLEGYDYVFVHNKSKDPGSHHFLGIINPDLIQMIELYNPDAILVYGWNFYSHLRILRHFNGKICLLFRGDSTLLNETYRLSIKKIFRRILLRWVYSHVDKAFYVGTSNKEYFLACGLQTAQLIYAPHAIDNDRFMAEGLNNEVKALEWRNKLGIYDSDILFLFAGKLEFQKNPFLLLEAFNSLTSSNIKLLIVGNGPLEEKLKKVSQNNKRVIFLDFQNQQIMPIIYRLGDVMILPSISETWGLSVNEAMACGRPVIVSDACGCEKDLIIHGITGYSFKSGNVFDLVKCMSLLSDKKKVIAMRDAVLKFIQSFNYSRVAQSIENNI
jgi:glycosyltransferase involved in cell wall biosynthesis